MQRKYLFTTLAVLAAAVGALTWTLTRSTADQPNPAGNAKGAGPLPIAQVILFNSGVGYFERQGEVNGDTRVDLTFPTSDVNDLLKSLVLQDTAGGRIHAISYDSQDPVEKILRSFALDLNSNPTYGQILNQARGEKIDVMRQEKPGANPFKVTGTIIGMESHREATGKDSFVEVEQLNLLTSEGMVAVPLTQVQSVHFHSQLLETEFRRALQVLAGAHDVQKKTVALQFNGNGKRGVKVGYVVERPIWKTTYRLVLEPNGKLFMQGWAIVENTSDDDWNNVRMVLVSGKPISFRMDLYDPLYIPRPLVEPELFASLRPPVYGSSFADDKERKPAEGPPQQQVPGFPGQQGGFGGQGGFGAGGGGKAGAGIPPLQQRQQDAQAKDSKYQQNFNFDQNSANQNKLAYDGMMRRKEGQKVLTEAAKKLGGTIAGLNFREGVQSLANSEEVGDYYQYIIDQKISLARQKSAMLPILNQSIEGSKVSIYNEAVQAKFPLLGIRLKNTSGKPLTQGPITVYDDGSYAGDTRTLDLQPNEERLLSYAIDQGTEVKTAVKTFPAPEMNFNIGGNNLTAAYTMRQTKTYTIKNRSTHDRTIIIEHRIRSDWKLVDPKTPSDKSRDFYRFQIEVKAGEIVKKEITEEQPRVDPVALSGGGDVPPRYAIFSGIEVKPQVTYSATKLLSLSINKGVLQAGYKQNESKTYFIQNMSERDHNFTVDHVIRKEWKRIDKDGKDQVGPAVYRFKVDVRSKETAHHEVAEEHVYQDRSQVVDKLDDATLQRFIAEKAPAAKVKDALQQVLDKRGKLKTLRQELVDLKANLDLATKDQARVLTSLNIIPQSSEHYKDFLKKFVALEAQIGEAQRNIFAQETVVQRTEKEYQTFVKGLTMQ